MKISAEFEQDKCTGVTIDGETMTLEQARAKVALLRMDADAIDRIIRMTVPRAKRQEKKGV
jgi:hypothetical protein